MLNPSHPLLSNSTPVISGYRIPMYVIASKSLYNNKNFARYTNSDYSQNRKCYGVKAFIALLSYF